jgi:hypothetical protein
MASTGMATNMNAPPKLLPQLADTAELVAFAKT